jgi:hypothetical protein
MGSLVLIDSLPIRSDDADFLTADARELYRHPNEPIFLLLILGGEGILVRDDNRGCQERGMPSQSLGASFP